MAETDDSAWVFDSLIGFLQGPIWSAPLLTFIEEKSLIFEPETSDCKEYREVHQEYKNLVDLLLGCYMEDMSISPEQFERACDLNKSTRLSVQFQQSLFEQIWAANEYEVFKRMMVQKNLELQLQALKMIEQKYGLAPTAELAEPINSLQHSLEQTQQQQHQHELTLSDELLEEDLPVVEQLLRIDHSPREPIHQLQQQEVDDPNDQESESSLAGSSKEHNYEEKRLQQREALIKLESEKLAKELSSESALLARVLDDHHDQHHDEPSGKEKQKRAVEGTQKRRIRFVVDEKLEEEENDEKSEMQARELVNDEGACGGTFDFFTSGAEGNGDLELQPPFSGGETLFSSKSKEETREEDIRKRTQYLKAQRDKLVALKKQARSKKLQDGSGGTSGNARPSSARVAAEATIDGKQRSLQQHNQALDESVMQVRKALAARLKAEVVRK
ncbi:hypothetical protein QAD02_001397 [Eretmocerus hayati]|uniref:Uncharacterized protein n=1 Tax=Eretmocerus hayati TaxID=131215 RepID=A0ACC2NGW0_9HYME|nr:hypothetical protein QAD02_001397 [Eretmocerus hayati]